MHEKPDAPLDEELLLVARRTLARRLRELRVQRDLSQDVAASHAGMHQTAWSRIESGVSDPRLSSLLRIQHALSLDSLESLFGPAPSRQALKEGGS